MPRGQHMTVTVETFNAYSGNFEDSPEAVLLKGTFLSSAEEIVSGYLGFDPKAQEYADVTLSGTGGRKLYLPSHQVTALHSLTVDGTVRESGSYSIHGDHICSTDRHSAFAAGTDNILISYSAGWTAQDMPSVITLSILRVATLMLSETGGNIGLTGKSFADNSRTFINYSNYRKYLQPLDALRIIRF